MRVHLHDFSGHPFQVQLSRALAGRDHEVIHSYCPQYVSGRGRLATAPDDPQTLRITTVEAAHPMIKYAPVQRLRFEASFARAWLRALDKRADVVVLCNVPLFALAMIHRQLARWNIPMVLWHQDLFCTAIADEAAAKLPTPAARVVRNRVERLESWLVEHSDAVVTIGRQFVDRYREWGVDTEHVTVVPNWAPVDELLPGARANDWSRSVGLADGGPLRMMYTGTLGRKHNPQLLLDLVERVRGCGVDAELVVVSEGVGATYVQQAAVGRDYVRVLPFQPADLLSDVMASGDILVALLEPAAAAFSIPSKITSYMCAGRPILTLAPPDAAFAVDVRAAGGFVSTPDTAGVEEGADWVAALADRPAERAMIGAQARRLAEATFDVHTVADEFEIVLKSAIARTGQRPPRGRLRDRVRAARWSA